jgi:hypothetical protein
MLNAAASNNVTGAASVIFIGLSVDVYHFNNGSNGSIPLVTRPLVSDIDAS